MTRFIKHNWKVYKEVDLETLSKKELLEVVNWIENIPEKEIVYRDFETKTITLPNISTPPWLKPTVVNYTGSTD